MWGSCRWLTPFKTLRCFSYRYIQNLGLFSTDTAAILEERTSSELNNTSQHVHRTLHVLPREVNKRATRAIREKGSQWIPAYLEGRRIIPSVALQVQWLPIEQDFMSGYFAVQRLGKHKYQGPLYELYAVPFKEVYSLSPVITEETQSLPFTKIRAILKNLVMHPAKDKPVSATFVLQPLDRPVKVRLPIRYINEEKCIGLKEGWINELVRYIDIRAPPSVDPPKFVELDLEGLRLKQKRYIRDLKFEGMHQGCHAVLPPDTPIVMISKP